jgi:hypothetical protein
LKFSSSKAKIKLDKELTIINVVPTDFNRDGMLDLLVSYRKKAEKGPLYHRIYFGNNVELLGTLYSSFSKYPYIIADYVNIPPTSDEYLLVDFFGDSRIGLLGVHSGSEFKDKLSITTYSSSSQHQYEV